MTDYSIYDQLDVTEPHFRLVSIHPASGEEELVRCSLITTKMKDAPEYEALSYTWGDPSDPESITVNNRPFLATRNLARALRGLRHEDRDRVMWIDAIAICQNNNVEKNHQIPLMTRIYGDAARVVVWLGAGEKAAAFIRSVHRDNLHWDTRNQPSHKYGMVEVVVMLRSLYTSPWWQRVWTVQETMLARDLVFHCSRGVILTEEEIFNAPLEYAAHAGDCCRYWDDFESTGAPYISFRDSVERYMDPIRTLRNFRQRLRERDDKKLWLEPLAAQFRYRNATDPRDKLYGLLGISDYSSVCPPPIDYDRPIAECYKAMACWMMHNSRTLDVLNMVETHPRGTQPIPTPYGEEPIAENIPSWCPNWTAPPNKMFLTATEMRLFDFAFYNAGKKRIDTNLSLPIPKHQTPTQGWMVAPSETDDFWIPVDDIGLFGLQFDTVKAVDTQEMIASSESLSGWKELARSTVATGSLKDSTYASGNGDAQEALNSTLCADIIKRRLHKGGTLIPGLPIFYSRTEDADHVADEFARLWATVEAMTPGDINDPLFNREFPSVSSAIQLATTNRRFFVTEKGYFGLGPPTTQEGDAVWVLSGGKTPYILRQADGPSAGTWAFAGEAYVHGIMQGEAFNEHIRDNGEIVLQLVVLQ